MRRSAAPGGAGRLVPALALILVTTGCSGRSGEAFPTPGWERGGVPALADARVLVLPLQTFDAQDEWLSALDHEVWFALRTRAPQVDWRDRSSLGATAADAGRLGADPADLPVGIFGVGEVRRVGDPLFGDLYRLASFIEADLVVLPIRGWWVEGVEGTRAVALHGAVVSPRNGQVLWQGIVRGAFSDTASPAAPASAAEGLARRLLR